MDGGLCPGAGRGKVFHSHVTRSGATSLGSRNLGHLPPISETHPRPGPQTPTQSHSALPPRTRTETDPKQKRGGGRWRGLHPTKDSGGSTLQGFLRRTSAPLPAEAARRVLAHRGARLAPHSPDESAPPSPLHLIRAPEHGARGTLSWPQTRTPGTPPALSPGPSPLGTRPALCLPTRRGTVPALH